jgi:hypothetical protein
MGALFHPIAGASPWTGGHHHARSHLVQRSPAPLPADAKYPIPKSQRGRWPDHGIPSPVRRERVVQAVVWVGVYPFCPVPHAQVLAQRQSHVRLADGHERERHPGVDELGPPRRILEDLLLAEGSPERPREDEQRRPRRGEEVGGRRRRSVEAVHGSRRREHSPPDVYDARERGGRAGKGGGGGGGASAVGGGAVVLGGSAATAGAPECRRWRRGSMRRLRRRGRQEGIRRRCDDEQGQQPGRWYEPLADAVRHCNLVSRPLTFFVQICQSKKM